MILLVTPTAVDSTHGNGVTARRWAGILRDLGHRVEIAQEYRPGRYDALLALHARKSADAIRAFRADRFGAPVVIALTGTDLYPSLQDSGVDPEILAMADRFIVLQRRGLAQLPPDLAKRADVIVQSLPPVPPCPQREDCFEVAFLTHVRPVKDPMRLAGAVRLLPADSRIRVTHVGEDRDESLSVELAAESAVNPRYDWRGAVSREEALAILARSRLLVLTSLHEGGANVVSEALAARVPVISSAIEGSIGLLGEDYPGYFPAEDTRALTDALYAAERDETGYLRKLTEHCEQLAGQVDPALEREAFRRLLDTLGVTTSARRISA
ncbi:selenoneine biosynthesis selenosugar synthase SenB [Streptomyces sp. BB1-1-1]|uniref:selenoneine biosynthesis selenosugar synthase SenB n=1 Tax=Streptomyces sp. BB1-1-1 TaxID=3074430 RepID=UPI002877A4A8|nr:selenoneine biosynthesis selenosugar synthase SenB [Streptomyces sp. BB1-1-1]WND33500.1 selenoneine biosynthesis selenosugar synthase SenB [Streptomyces sp. BB1-1-1]